MASSSQYIAVPKAETGGAVLVLHSWWGLNAFFRGLCDRLARAGFVALAPDLYDGKVATTVAQAKRLRAEATASRRVPAYKMLMGSIDQLARHEAAKGKGVALMGFSMGGHWALWLAQRPELPIQSTVVFYAARNGDFSESRSNFQFHFAEQDEWVSAANIKKMTRSIEAAGKRAEVHRYSDTGHWFFESDRPEAFRPQAASLAWKRSLAFLRGTEG